MGDNDEGSMTGGLEKSYRKQDKEKALEENQIACQITLGNTDQKKRKDGVNVGTRRKLHRNSWTLRKAEMGIRRS